MKTSVCIMLLLFLAAAGRTFGDTICDWTRHEATNEQRYHDVLTLDGGVICLQETITNSDGPLTTTYKVQLSQVDSITDPQLDSPTSPDGWYDVKIVATGNAVNVQVDSDTLPPDHDVLLVFATRERAVQIVAQLRQLVAGR